MDILFMIPTLGSGGAERALLQLVNSYAKNQTKDKITVLTLFDVGGYRDNLVQEINYKYVFKRMFRGNIHFLKLFSPKFLYKHMIKQKYDIIISYLEGPTTRIISGCYDKETKIINWIHTSPTNSNVLLTSYRNRNEFVSCMSKYDDTIFVAKSAKSQFLNCFPELCNLTMDIIYNPINSREIRCSAKEHTEYSFQSNAFNIISIGRLSPVKGFDRLIRTCVKLKKNYNNIYLYIIGGGNKEKLQKLILENKAESYIFLMGYKENPYSLLSNASLFVCSSYREGYSTSVIESLILGVPVVTTMCSGMEEILGFENEYGLIVENSEDGLYYGISKLIDDNTTYEYYKRKSIERGKIFSLENGVSAVKKLLENSMTK